MIRTSLLAVVSFALVACSSPSDGAASSAEELTFDHSRVQLQSYDPASSTLVYDDVNGGATSEPLAVGALIIPGILVTYTGGPCRTLAAALNQTLGNQQAGMTPERAVALANYAGGHCNAVVNSVDGSAYTLRPVP